MAVRCYKATVTLVDHLWYCATFQVNLLLAPLWRTMGLDALIAHDSWPADIDSIRCLQFRQFSSVYSCLHVLSIWYAYIRSASCAARWCPLIFASWCGACAHSLKKRSLLTAKKILQYWKYYIIILQKGTLRPVAVGNTVPEDDVVEDRTWRDVATDLVQFRCS